ncbi:MAG TPA: TonB-dependent receptor plug domain-containing protein, partial [Puia sp.]|nr:TonB-dependent receptor plug domain-containing protein [Puia sp.]
NQNITTGGGSSTLSQSTFLVLMDGVQVNAGSDIKGFLESIDESNVEFIEVLKGPQTAIYGMQGAPGVILIHSRNNGQGVAPQDVAQVNEKGLATISPKGYCNQPDVFATGYDERKGVQDVGKVDAPTLYWNANLLTDNQGNAQVDFSTALRRATYSAAIVGFIPGAGIVEKTIRIICR